MKGGFALRNRLTRLPGDPPITIDLQSVFNRCYEAGPYAREIRYGEDKLVPALNLDQEAWADRIVQASQLE